MMKSKIVTSVLLLLSFSFSAGAVDNPQDVIGAEKYDRQQCVSNNSQACINSTCLNSDEIDCQANCRTLAEQKCQQDMNE